MKLFTFCCFFTSLFSIAQSYKLTGKVQDISTNELLPTAAILVENGNAVRADFDGEYSIEVKKGSQHITVKMIGYESLDTIIVVTGNAEFNFKLKPDQLEEVVVAAGRFEQSIEEVSVSINIIKPSLIENKATIDCEQIIEQVPGLTVQDGQVSIRGGSGFAYGAGSRVLVLVDELPMLSADAGDVKWNALPVENIEQIEIIKGASSVLYGSSALNGVINIRTKYPRNKPETRVNMHHGYFDNPKRESLRWWNSNPYYIGGNFYHMRKIKDNFDLVVGGNMLSSTGYRQGEDEERFRLNANTRYRSKKVEGLSYGANFNSQFARTGLFVLWENDSLGYSPSGGADPNSESTTLTFQDGWRTNVDPFISYYTKNGAQHNVRTRWFRTNNINNQGRGARADLYYGEYQYQKYFDSLDMNITAGFSAYRNIIVADLYGDHDGKNIGAFAQVDKKWRRFNFNAGLRFEYFKLDTAETKYEIGGSTIPVQPIFRSGLTYKLREHSILRASWGQGYRFPSVAEKYAATNLGSVSIFPNASLQPERGWSAEIGFKQGVKLGKWRGYVDVAAFWTEYQNMIEFTFDEYIPEGVVPQLSDPNAPNYLYDMIGFQARNAENARITGVDISLTGQGQLNDELSLTVFAGYTYMNPITLNSDSAYLSTFSDTTTNMLKYRYRHLVKGDVQVDYKKWSFGVSSRYNSFMSNIDETFLNLVIDFNGFPISLGDQVLPGLPGYRERNNRGDLVFDFRTSYQINEQFKMAFLMNNALNREYAGRPGDIGAPRTFIGQLTLSF